MLKTLQLLLGPQAPLLRRYAWMAALYGALCGLCTALLLPLMAQLLQGQWQGAGRWLLALLAAVAAAWWWRGRVEQAGVGVGVAILQTGRHRLGAHVARLPMGWFSAQNTARVSHLVTQGMMAVGQLPAHVFTPVISGVVAPLVVNDLGYDADKDFVPVSEANSYVFGVAVSSAVPVKEMSHLLAWLKANPAKANIGVPATGSLPHFFALMLGQQAQVQAEAVGYKGSAPLLTDLMGGQVPVAVDTLDTLVQQHEAGKLRILAVSGDTRNAALPNVPTLKESGTDLSAAGWNTFFANKTMPAAQVKRYADAIQKVMQDPEVLKQFKTNHLDPVVSSDVQTAERLAAYKKQWAPVIKASGYKP